MCRTDITDKHDASLIPSVPRFTGHDPETQECEDTAQPGEGSCDGEKDIGAKDCAHMAFVSCDSRNRQRANVQKWEVRVRVLSHNGRRFPSAPLIVFILLCLGGQVYAFSRLRLRYTQNKGAMANKRRSPSCRQPGERYLSERYLSERYLGGHKRYHFKPLYNEPLVALDGNFYETARQVQ